jgi:uncharacterized repeat protein (TIGR01451 family)
MNMKRRISLIVLAAFLGALSSVFIIMQARAQINAFTFFIPYPAARLDDQFNEGFAGADLIGYDIETVISIAVRRDGTVIYYDNWEDGFEANLTSPTQSTTWIWGDGNPANNGGVAIPNNDNLSAGDIIPLRNTVELTDDGSRDRDEFFFDGRDTLSSVGGAIAVTLAVWPQLPAGDSGVDPGSLYAGAWELFPTSSWGQDYRIPIGENLSPEDAPPGSPTRAGFRVVGLNVTAVEDDTTVEIDLDADGNPDTTRILNKGQQLTRIGSQVGIGGASVLVGARVQADRPVQVHVFAADPAARWEARAYTMFPFDALEDEWLTPRASDGDFWLYNPNDDVLTVTVRTTIAPPDTITIPGRSTIKYPIPGMSGATGAHFMSTDERPFDGVVALSADDARDWGYPTFPVSALTNLALVGWAPGNNQTPPSGWPGDPAGLEASRVYVTALNPTIVTVIFDLSTSRSADFPIIPLEEVDIIDPVDYDMTGAVLYTADGEAFAAVWGQDQTAPAAQPSIDAGTGIVPLASMAVQKTITLIDDADGSGDISWGDTLRFEIFTVNNTNQILRDAVISDTLPSTVDYVPQSSTARSAPIPDDSPPRTIFPFDEGGYPVGDLQPSEAVTGTFDAVVKDGVEEICNTAGADSPSVPPPDDATACVPVDPSISTPTPEPPEEEEEDEETPEPTPPPPTPTPTPIPTATPVVFVTPTLPVVYLPETGTADSQAGTGAKGPLLLVTISLAILAIGAKLVHRGSKQKP